MTTLTNVTRYHLTDRLNYVALPWAIVTLVVLANLALFAVLPPEPGGYHTGAVVAIYIMLFVLGITSVTKSLPFGLTLGLSRRSYYLGTILMVFGLGAVYALALAALQGIERATGGWGVTMHFFRVPWILDGAWYLTWLTSFVVLVLAFVYGMWWGLVHYRWDLLGLVAFAAAHVLVLLGGALLVTWADAWGALGEFLVTLSATGVTTILAALAAVLTIGGFTTMRRVTV